MTKEELQAKWEQSDRDEINTAIQALITVPQGRRLLRRWLEFGRIGSNPFATNALSMSFGCGELNVGQAILSDILAIAPEGYIAIQKDIADDDRTRSNALRTATDSE